MQSGKDATLRLGHTGDTHDLQQRHVHSLCFRDVHKLAVPLHEETPATPP